MEFFFGLAAACWDVLVESAPYILFGFFVAGVLKAFLPDDLVARHLGRPGAVSVLKASILGVPLPLCSCGVIPAAMGLKKQGANKGATAAFMISTPETGVDSMAITYALLDPLMTVLRPLAALISATTTGLLINRLPEEMAASAPTKTGCGCSDAPTSAPKQPWRKRLAEGMDFAFIEMMNDIGRWFLLGVLLAGLIAFLVPDRFFSEVIQGEWQALLLMLIVGVPMYICATASTPIAAALVLKGLDPGAALVFLLAGPATNVATMTVIARCFGRRALIVYIASIGLTSLALGWLVNRLYPALGLSPQWQALAGDAEHHGVFALLSVVLLLLVLVWAAWKSRQRGGCCTGES